MLRGKMRWACGFGDEPSKLKCKEGQRGLYDQVEHLWEDSAVSDYMYFSGGGMSGTRWGLDRRESIVECKQ